MKVLHPGEVGVALGREAELPAHVQPQVFTAPIAHVERRVGENEIGLKRIGPRILTFPPCSACPFADLLFEVRERWNFSLPRV